MLRQAQEFDQYGYGSLSPPPRTPGLAPFRPFHGVSDLSRSFYFCSDRTHDTRATRPGEPSRHVKTFPKIRAEPVAKSSAQQILHRAEHLLGSCCRSGNAAGIFPPPSPPSNVGNSPTPGCPWGVGVDGGEGGDHALRRRLRPPLLEIWSRAERLRGGHGEVPAVHPELSQPRLGAGREPRRRPYEEGDGRSLSPPVLVVAGAPRPRGTASVGPLWRGSRRREVRRDAANFPGNFPAHAGARRVTRDEGP